MKVPPKRKGNLANALDPFTFYQALNESPSEKEGKQAHVQAAVCVGAPSMKVPPKRKGNT